MTHTEALKLALELKNSASGYWTEKEISIIEKLIDALAQPQQEPVAWRTFDGEGGYEYRAYEMNEQYAQEWEQRNPKHKDWVEPLYTSPPQRTWVGLTDEELSEFDVDPVEANLMIAKLKELNK